MIENHTTRGLELGAEPLAPSPRFGKLLAVIVNRFGPFAKVNRADQILSHPDEVAHLVGKDRQKGRWALPSIWSHYPCLSKLQVYSDAFRPN
jgi:hypothetical protein